MLQQLQQFHSDDRGMSTIEYALGSLAAAALAGALYLVVSGGGISEALQGSRQGARHWHRVHTATGNRRYCSRWRAGAGSGESPQPARHHGGRGCVPG